MSGGHFYPYKLNKSICRSRGVWLINFNFFMLILGGNVQLLYTNSVDPAQAPRFAASHLYMHCLPMSM